MIRNHFKFAWRNFRKDIQFTLLNLIGLSTGLACTLLIYLWVNDEWKIDKFHENDQQLYQVMQNIHQDDGGIMTQEHTPDLLAQDLLKKMPEVEGAATVKFPDEDDNSKGILSANNSNIKAKELFVTSNFFNFFSFQLLEGNKDQILSNKFNVLLSDQLAVKLFHSSKGIIGKTVNWYRGSGAVPVNGSFLVSGIYKAPSANSSMQFDLLFPHELYVANSRQDINWLSNSPSTYILLKAGTDPKQFNSKLRDFIKSKFKSGSQEQKWAGTLFLQRFSDRYLYDHYQNGQVSGGRIEYVRLFSIIALFILVIACINFMNLSTAKVSGRIKEVGIKKVMGASRRSLIYQYLSESLLMAMLSLIFAICLVFLLLPAFREITGKNLDIELNPGLILTCLLITLVTGIVAGSYPAFYLSGFRPAIVLKSKFAITWGASWIRMGLVIFQFTISAILILSVLVVYQQMKFIQTKNLGYNKDHIIHFSNEGKLQQSQQAFLSVLRGIPGVVHASDLEGDMLGNHSGGGGISWPGKTERVEFSGLYVDYDFMETMGLSMQEGRMFSREFSTDSDGVIFNETAIRAMRLKDPIGKTATLWGRNEKIIGVVKDFHFESLYKKLGPFFLSFRKDESNIVVKIKAGAEKETLPRIEKLYKEYNSGLPFEYQFLDEDYHALYYSEQRVAVLSRYFAAMAIILSCLGLFGLAAFTAQKRQKEIGIRKVLGASIGQVVVLLSGDFLKIVLIAVLVAFPLAWWSMNKWLESFAYRVHIGFVVFLITGASTILITILTISYQSIRAALANPVKSLKTD